MPRRLRIELLCLFFALTLGATQAPAASLTNGDFGTGDFTGWSLDTDGWPGAEPTADFAVVAGQGVIGADGSASAWWANTLYQEMDTSLPAGYDLQLSFDWDFYGDVGATDEGLRVYLGDGSGTAYDQTGGLGFLLSEDAYGSGTFSTTLDPTVFGNAAGWTLEFQLLVGWDWEGSFVAIDNVALAAVGGDSGGGTAPVPEPGTMVLLGSGLVGLVGTARRRLSRSR